ncbi:MAG: helix-turn-helix transcriptional regulator [Bacteroidales bacterium]|nr:helix-turn-helix transcriptional regulator [Bacteroidales bacterium]
MKLLRIFPYLFILLILVTWMPAETLTARKENFERETTHAFYRNRINDLALPIDTRITYIDSLISEVQDNERLSLMIRRADILAEGCRYGEAYRQYDAVLQELPKDSLRLRLLIQLKLSTNAFYASRYRDALRNAIDLLRTKKPDTLLWLDIDANNILAAMDHYRGKDDRLDIYFRHMDDCLARLEKSNASREMVKKARSRVITSRAVSESDLHKAFNLYMKAKSMETDSARIDGLNNNIGFVHFRLREYEKARYYFETVLRSHRPGTARMCAVLNYIQSYINEKNGEGADSAVKKYMHVLRELDGTPMEWERHKMMFDVHYLNGRKLEGIPYLEMAIQLLDSLHSPDNELMYTDASNEVSELMVETKYGSQLLNSHNKTTIIMILGGALLLTVGATCFFHRKAHRKASEADVIASRLNETLSRHREEHEEIDQSLQMRGQELSSLKLRNEMLRNTLDSIVADVNRLDIPRRDLVKRVKETVRNLSGAENTFNPRSITLENVNQTFFDKLYTTHPDLTNAERDMCAYVLMGLQPKEIAALTNRSVKTVNCIRYNMRKKLGISSSESTEAYLRMISSGSSSTETPDIAKDS